MSVTRLEGIEAVTEKINSEIAKLKHKSSKGLASAAVFVANEAVKRAPIESGELKNSVYIDLDGKRAANGEKGILNANIGTNERMAAIGFCCRYAVKQHEDLSLNHNRDPLTEGYTVPKFNVRTGKENITAGKTYNMQPGGQAKFLESVLVEEQDRILRCIADSASMEDGEDD